MAAAAIPAPVSCGLPWSPHRPRSPMRPTASPHCPFEINGPLMSHEQTINDAWDRRASLLPAAVPPAVREAVDHAISELNAGRVRVAQKIDGQWMTHQWLKKAVLLSFRLNDNRSIHAGDLAFYDKVEPKFSHLDAAHMRDTGVRVVPPAVARRGSFIAKNVVLMPSYVNIGAYLNEGTMVDTWATVGSC